MKNYLIYSIFIITLCSSCVKDGPFTTIDKNGHKRAEGCFLNHKKQGTWKYYDIKGNIEHEINYKNGKKFGRYIHYCPNGQINDLHYYDNNEVKIGKSYNYFCSGKIRAVSNYKSGLLDSTNCFYYESGLPEYFINYKNGKRNGNSYYFNEFGDTSRIKYYINDTLAWVKLTD